MDCKRSGANTNNSGDWGEGVFLYDFSLTTKIFPWYPVEQDRGGSCSKDNLNPLDPFLVEPLMFGYFEDSLMSNSIKSFFKSNFRITISFYQGDCVQVANFFRPPPPLLVMDLCIDKINLTLPFFPL